MARGFLGLAAAAAALATVWQPSSSGVHALGTSA